MSREKVSPLRTFAHGQTWSCELAKEPQAILADTRAQLWVFHAEPLALGQAQHADLAHVAIQLHQPRRLAHLLQREDLRQRGQDPALRDQTSHLPRLLPVGSVATDDALELHQ